MGSKLNFGPLLCLGLLRSIVKVSGVPDHSLPGRGKQKGGNCEVPPLTWLAGSNAD